MMNFSSNRDPETASSMGEDVAHATAPILGALFELREFF